MNKLSINSILFWGLVIGFIAVIAVLLIKGFKLLDIRDAMAFGGLCSFSFDFLGVILIIQEEKASSKQG